MSFDSLYMGLFLSFIANFLLQDTILGCKPCILALRQRETQSYSKIVTQAYLGHFLADELSDSLGS